MLHLLGIEKMIQQSGKQGLELVGIKLTSHTFAEIPSEANRF
jgi:hypothetical protein